MSIPSSLVTKIVQAGAGTGKTESLAQEIIKSAKVFYEQNSFAPRFVATTFTERATAELRERVILISERDENKDLEWLTEFVKDQERLQISTLHGVFAKLLHRFGSHLDLDPEFKIIKVDEENDYLRQILRDFLRSEDSVGQDTHFLTGQYTFEGLVVLISKLLEGYRLHDTNFSPLKEWMSLIDKETDKLFEALQHVSQIGDADKPTPALNQTSAILKSLAHALPRVRLDYGKMRATLLESLDGVRKPTLKGNFETYKESMDEIFNIKTEWKAECYSPEANIKHGEVAAVLNRIVIKCSQELSDLKKRLGTASFSDLEFLTWELSQKNKEVRYQIKDLYDFWFIDEYQDTSPLQKQILFSFFKKPWNAYFVGDPQQSIYLFRGADQNVFEETKKLVLEQGGVLEKLEVNYRSQPDLLEFMNQLFLPLKAKGPRAGKVLSQIFFHENNSDESKLVLNKVLQWKNEGFNFHDICVLTRTNNQAHELAHYLSQWNIPVYVHASGGFYDKREVVDALSVLSFLMATDDDVIFATLARSPWFQISDQQLVDWAGEVRKTKFGFWAWLESKPEELEKFHSLKILRKALKELNLKPLSVVFETLLSQLGFFELCLVGDASGQREANLRKLVSQLRQAETRPGFSAAQFLKRTQASLNEESEAVSFIEPLRVNIMTIHKSKGLKFNCVIVPGCGEPVRSQFQQVEMSPQGKWAIQVLSDEKEEKISPLALYILKEQREEREHNESMRLFYVAVTRAAEGLCLISTKVYSPKSWMGKISIDLTDKIHETYLVESYKDVPFVEGPYQETHFASEISPEILRRVSRESEKQTVLESSEFMKLGLPIILKSQQRGIVLHGIFEAMKHYPQKPLQQIINEVSPRFHGDFNEVKVLEKTLAMQTPPIKQIMENGFSEWSFNFKMNEKDYSGRIDLWGTVGDTTWIIDYKSAGKVSGELQESAARQLKFYALALNKKGIAWEKMKLAIVLPQVQKVQEVELGSQQEVIDDIETHQLDHLTSDQI